MTKKELFEEFKKFTSPGTGLNLIDIQRAAIFEWFYIKMENRENDWTKMIRMMGVLVTTEAMGNKIIEQDKEIQSLTEQLQLMTGKYNGAKELFKQYQNEKP